METPAELQAWRGQLFTSFQFDTALSVTAVITIDSFHLENLKMRVENDHSACEIQH